MAGDNVVSNTVIDKKTTTSDAVSKAMGDVDADTDKIDKVDKVDDKTDDKTDKKDDKVNEVDDDAVKGRQLIQALRNPQSAALIIEALARKAGYTKAELKKAEPEEVKDDILEILKVELGDEFDFLNPKLAKALSKVLEVKLEKSQADIRRALHDDQLDKLNSEATRTLTSLAEKYYDKSTLPKDIYEQMNALQDKLSPGKNQTVKDYLEDLFFAVVGRRGDTLTTKAQRSKINRSDNDVPNKLTSGGVVPDGSGRSKVLNISEAVALAMAAADKE